MGQQQPQVKREIRLISSMMRQERPEDPNVWKPKHASKSKEEKENPDKSNTEVDNSFNELPNVYFIARILACVQELLKTVRGILNKLTPSKFDKLLIRIQALNIDSEERLAGVIKLFFEKVLYT